MSRLFGSGEKADCLTVPKCCNSGHTRVGPLHGHTIRSIENELTTSLKVLRGRCLEGGRMAVDENVGMGTGQYFNPGRTNSHRYGGVDCHSTCGGARKRLLTHLDVHSSVG